MDRANAGIADPREGRRGLGRKIVGYALPLIFTAAFLGAIALFWLPDGIRLAKPAPYEGMLHIWDQGPGIMSFTTAELLRENEALRARGSQKSELICVDAPPDQLRRIEEALRGVPGEELGGRTLWVRMVAERRLGVWPCARHYGRPTPGKRKLGTLLRIVSIERIRPLGCDSLHFRINHLRCPPKMEAPVPPPPVVVEDSENQLYPRAALRAGKEGAVTVQGLVGPDGALLSCEVLGSSGDRSLDSGTCDLLRKRPELISKRGPVSDSGSRRFRQRIVWKLPERPPAG